MKRLFPKSFSMFILVALLLFNGLSLFPRVTATEIVDDITEDTIWAVADSPYEIRNDIKVNRGVTLTIEPGVAVSFGKNAALIVEGSLIAVGNSSSRITFSSNQPAPARGQWTGIRFVGGGNESFTVKFADVTYARNGIAIESIGNVLIEQSEIANNSLSGIHVIGQANAIVKENTIKLNSNGITTGGNTSSGIQIVHNAIVSNDEDGIYISSSGADFCRIYNVTIWDNQISYNGNGIYMFSNTSTRALNTEARIDRVTISGNTISFNGYGVHLRTYAWGDGSNLHGGFIYYSNISNNIVASNKKAITVHSESAWYSWISDVTISSNKILANNDGISLHAFRKNQPAMEPGPFDTTLSGNIVSANNDTAVSITGDVRANLTGNSVSYNSYGFNITSEDNLARKNDIYSNSLYGMYVTDIGTVKAQIDAEDNFWGASTGPFHEFLNPEGQGDRVNGDGENLDFYPWLDAPLGYINEAPVAKLEMSKTTVSLNQNVTLDGLNSEDDLRVVAYFFDFGDGENSGWISGPIIEHTYVSEGVYTVSLIVMDEFGVRSLTAVETVTVTIPLLDASVFLDPIFVLSQGQILVEVTVTDAHAGEQDVGVQDVLVQLTSDEGGDFNPASGFTDSNGYFNSTFSAPKVSESTSVRITVIVSKGSCENSSKPVYLSVVNPSSNSGGFDILLVLLVAASVVIAIALVIVKRRKRRRRLAKQKSSSSTLSPAKISVRLMLHLPFFRCKSFHSLCRLLRGHVRLLSRLYLCLRLGHILVAPQRFRKPRRQ